MCSFRGVLVFEVLVFEVLGLSFRDTPIGTPICSHNLRKFAKSAAHYALVGAINKKSSRICKTADAFKRCVDTHSDAGGN